MYTLHCSLYQLALYLGMAVRRLSKRPSYCQSLEVYPRSHCSVLLICGGKQPHKLLENILLVYWRSRALPAIGVVQDTVQLLIQSYQLFLQALFSSSIVSKLIFHLQAEDLVLRAQVSRQVWLLVQACSAIAIVGSGNKSCGLLSCACGRLLFS